MEEENKFSKDIASLVAWWYINGGVFSSVNEDALAKLVSLQADRIKKLENELAAEKAAREKAQNENKRLKTQLTDYQSRS